LSAHFLDVGERGEMLAGYHFDGKAAPVRFLAETRNGHPAQRESDLDGFRKSKWGVLVDGAGFS
jgi:hypothetical protein